MTETQKLEATFSTLIISIASSAVVSLGLEKNPQTNKIEKNLDMARYSIDLLVLLREKTKNNGNHNHNGRSLLNGIQTLAICVRIF